MKLASAVVLAVASIARANAYMDPGTGSMLAQMSSAAVAGAVFYFHELRMKIVARLEAIQSPGSRPERSS